MDIEKTKMNLMKRGYKVNCFTDSKEAAEYIDKNVDDTTVGFGGSVTLDEMQLLPMLQKHNTVYWHNDSKQTEEFGSKVVRDMAIDTEVYISSVNAISENGEIVNIDHTGNRISAMTYGHKKVYFVAGVNKIEPDLEKAMWRARNIAAPKNAQRLHRKTPCAAKGDKCYDCQSPERICRGFLVLDRVMAGADMEVILVEEQMGY